MFIELDKIKQLEVELSTYCNAACPGCSRHYWGTSDKLPNLVEEHLDVDDVTKVIKQIPNINELEIHLCGNLGDPLMNPRILEGIQEWVDLGVHKVFIDTNGGLRSEEFWRKLAKIPRLDCTFSIDGLEDTNHIYRVNVNWQKLERNFMAYIEEGGKATWKYLIFEHNKHQTKEAGHLAKFYGFSRFDARMSMREPPDLYQTLVKESGDKSTDFMVKKAQDLRSNEIDTVAPTEEINCKSLALSRIYLNGEGRIWPCCYTSQHYCKSHIGWPHQFEENNPYLFNHYNKGFNLVKKNSLEYILKHGVWEHLNEAWQEKSSCEYKVCWKICKGKAWTLNNAIEDEETAWSNSSSWSPA